MTEEKLQIILIAGSSLTTLSFPISWAVGLWVLPQAESFATSPGDRLPVSVPQYAFKPIFMLPKQITGFGSLFLLHICSISDLATKLSYRRWELCLFDSLFNLTLHFCPEQSHWQMSVGFKNSINYLHQKMIKSKVQSLMIQPSSSVDFYPNKAAVLCPDWKSFLWFVERWGGSCAVRWICSMECSICFWATLSSCS